MATNGIARKLVVVAAALGAILLVLRAVGGRGGDGIDEDGIDRVDTGRSDEDDDSEGGPVDTGLERVSTDDTDAGEDTLGTTDTVGTSDDPDAGGVEAESSVDGLETDEEDEEVAVEPTAGRFDDLDVFDIISIVSAGFEAAREEYRSRT
jgi:hypothetical protein